MERTFRKNILLVYTAGALSAMVLEICVSHVSKEAFMSLLIVC